MSHPQNLKIDHCWHSNESLHCWHPADRKLDHHCLQTINQPALLSRVLPIPEFLNDLTIISYFTAWHDVSTHSPTFKYRDSFFSLPVSLQIRRLHLSVPFLLHESLKSLLILTSKGYSWLVMFPGITDNWAVSRLTLFLTISVLYQLSKMHRPHFFYTYFHHFFVYPPLGLYMNINSTWQFFLLNIRKSINFVPSAQYDTSSV